MWIHYTGVVSSDPTRVTIETPLARKGTENHLMTSMFPRKGRALRLVSATLEIEYSTQL